MAQVNGYTRHIRRLEMDIAGLDFTSIILQLAQTHPNILIVVTGIGALRIIAKPIMSGVRTLVKATPTPKDDELLGKVMGSKMYKMTAWAIDYVASIKLPGHN